MLTMWTQVAKEWDNLTKMRDNRGLGKQLLYMTRGRGSDKKGFVYGKMGLGHRGKVFSFSPKKSGKFVSLLFQ